jgi:Uma2 family endonuclease
MMAVEETTEESSNEMPTYNHSYICLEIIIQILALQKFRPLPELTLNIGKGITPDISVYPVELAPQPNFFSDITRYDKMPLLAIEVISPSQNIQDLLEKAQMLTESGTNTVWTIEPFSHSIWVTTTEGTKLFHNTVIESEGISVDFQKIFGSDISLSA